jgi:hypothetical protein
MYVQHPPPHSLYGRSKGTPKKVYSPRSNRPMPMKHVKRVTSAPNSPRLTSKPSPPLSPNLHDKNTIGPSGSPFLYEEISNSPTHYSLSSSPPPLEIHGSSDDNMDHEPPKSNPSIMKGGIVNELVLKPRDDYGITNDYKASVRAYLSRYKERKEG